jgi:hypothetical protein
MELMPISSLSEAKRSRSKKIKEAIMVI